MFLMLYEKIRILLLCLAFLRHPEMSTTAKLPATTSTNDSNWWHNAVFYQIYPRSFKDSDGDGIGDLKGIHSKLEHLADSGITATWLSPIFKSPMVDFGYDVSDFKAIHHEYGTMEDFDNLITKANQLGIRIILDFVPNHSSNEHEWFVKSEAREEGYEDFYVWHDGKIDEATGERQPPNNWQSVFFGPAWTWSERRQQYYLHQFTREQPDLNFRNPRVVEAMDDVLTFWLQKGAAGFRIDAVNHLFEDPEFKDEPLSGKTANKDSYEYTKHIYTKDLPEVFDMLHHWRALLDAFTAQHGGPQRIMMTEAYADLKSLMDYYEDASGQLGSHFPFNFFFITDLNAESDARDFVHSIQKWLTFMPHGRGHIANWVMGNHDNPRVASRYGPERVDAMNMLLMTLPGVAVTYNGEEMGMEDHRDISWEDTVDPPARNVGKENYKKASRDPVRTPFQWDSTENAGFSTAAKTWLPVHPNYKELNLEQQKASPKSHYSVYKSLVQLRQFPVLQRGKLQIEALTRNVFVLKRYLRGQAAVITVINVSPEAASVDLTDFLETNGHLEVLVASSHSDYEKGHQLAINDLHLPPHEGLVCRLEDN